MPNFPFDIDLDKHLNPTLIISCPTCRKNHRYHVKTLKPDQVLCCECGDKIEMTLTRLAQIQKKIEQMRT